MRNKVVHWIAAIVLFGVPVLLHDSALTTITIGAILNGLYLWASHAVSPTISVASAKAAGYHG